MDSDALRDQLTKLHEELARAQSLDASSNELLAHIMEDIKRLMERAATPPMTEASPAAPQAAAVAPARAEMSLPDRLEKMAVRFEIAHPTLAASLRRLVDLLGKAGL